MKKKVLIIGINSLVGRSIEVSLKNHYKIVGTAGHSKVEGGYMLPIEEPDQLLQILDKEQPEFDFQKKVCDAVGIGLSIFEVEKATQQEF